MVINYGAGEGGGSKSSFTHTKSRCVKRFCHAEGGGWGGGTKSVGVVFTRKLEVLAILKRERKKAPP